MTVTQDFQRKHPLAECESCPLYTNSFFVPSDGPDKAALVLVGEAPGRDEVRGGKPFVGASGKLLDQLLPSIGLERADVFITNVCLCRPKDNANPPTQAIRSCHNRLVSEIEEREPTVVVALGNFAARAILGTDEGITKLRVGPPKQTDVLEGELVVIPTFHPAASLYNPGAFPDIVTDFEKIPAALGRKETIHVSRDWTVPEIRIFDSPLAGDAALTELLNASRIEEVALDIEVGTEKDTDLGRADRQELLCVGISHRAGAAFVLGTSAVQNGSVRSKLGDVMARKRIIAQNGKFDLAGLTPFNPEAALTALSFDTMLAHYTLDERRGTHSLDQLAIEYLGSPDWKAEFRRVRGGGSYADAPRDLLYKYNAYDASNTFLLKEVLAKEMEREDLTRLHDFLVRTSPVLMRMEANGLGVDLDYNQEVGEELLETIGGYKSYLQEVTESPNYNPNSWQQVQNMLKSQFGKRVKNTRKETIMLLQESAARVQDMVLYQFCEAHLAFKKDAKSYGTYIKGIRNRTEVIDGVPRVFTDFLLHGTVTGRLASRNPNLQNITRGDRLRRQFIPSSPDHVFVQADYGQAELRVVCWLARDAYLREVFSDDSRDIHGEVATRFYGEGWTKEQRVRAKAVVFGLAYGRESFSLAAEHRMSVREAQNYIDTFFEAIPDTVEWINNIESSILNGDDLINPFGRHRRFWLITQKNRESVLKEGRSFLPQSTASDITLEAANRLARMGLWDNLRILIHDAIVVECHKDEAEDMASLMKEVMEATAFELAEEYVPFPVDIKVGKNWGELD